MIHFPTWGVHCCWKPRRIVPELNLEIIHCQLVSCEDDVKCRLLLSRKLIITYHQSRSHPPSTPHPRTNSLKQRNGFERAFYNCIFKELLSKFKDVYKSRRCSTCCECATADACHELTFLLEQFIKILKLRKQLLGLIWFCKQL